MNEDKGLDQQFESIKQRLLKMEETPPFRFIRTDTKLADEYMNSRRIFEGWDNHKIKELSEQLDTIFPIQFNAYLRHFGCKRGLLLVVSDVPSSVEGFTNLKLGCLDFIRETHPEATWVEGCIPFLMHQGYVVEYILEDGSVWYWIEGEDWPEGAKKISDSLNQYLIDQLELIEKVYEGNVRMGGYYVTIRIKNGDRVFSETHPALSSGDHSLDRPHDNFHITDVQESPKISKEDFLEKIRNRFNKKNI